MALRPWTKWREASAAGERGLDCVRHANSLARIGQGPILWAEGTPRGGHSYPFWLNLGIGSPMFVAFFSSFLWGWMGGKQALLGGVAHNLGCNQTNGSCFGPCAYDFFQQVFGLTSSPGNTCHKLEA